MDIFGVPNLMPWIFTKISVLGWGFRMILMIVGTANFETTGSPSHDCLSRNESGHITMLCCSPYFMILPYLIYSQS